MRPDLIVKNRKLNRFLGVVGVILSVVMFFLAMWNIGWLYRLVGLCAITYYLVDIEQGLEESHAVTRSIRIVLMIIGVLYIGLSMACVFVNVDVLLRLFGLAGAGYLGFKTNTVFRKDLKNKKLKFWESIVAICLGLGAAILLILLTPKDILWLFLLIFALAYNLIHLIVRIKVEHDGTNREL